MPLNLASPGIVVREVDLTIGRVDPTSGSIGALVAPFAKGPVNDPQLIESEEDLLQTFGQPYSTDKHYEYWMVASSYLAYGGTMQVVRADDFNTQSGVGLKNAFVTGGVGVGATMLRITSNTHYNQLGYDENTISGVSVAAKNPGTWANGIKVAIIDGKADQILTVASGNTTAVGSAVTQSISKTIGTATGTTTIDGVLKGIVTGSTDTTLEVKVISHISAAGVETAVEYQQNGTYTFDNSGSVNVIAAGSSGSGSAKSYTAQTDWFESQNIVLSNSTLEWDSIADAPGTSTYVSTRGGKNDEIHVLVIDDKGTITGNSGTILEKHLSLSKAKDAEYSVGSSSYWRDFLATNSKYIFGGGATSGITTTGYSVSSTNTLDTDSGWDQNAEGVNFGASGVATLTLAGGTNYGDKTDLTTSGALSSGVDDIISGYTLFENTEEIEVDFILMGAAHHPKEQSQAVAEKVTAVAEARKDAVAFISPYRQAFLNDTVSGTVTVSNIDQTTENVVGFYAPLSSSTYSVFDSGYKYMFDRFNNTFRYVPLNGDIAGTCARTDIEQFPWFSPAGTARGPILNSVKLVYNPGKKQRDILYSNRINPVILSPGAGIILFGDKTGFGKSSAFDRINVRRLFIYLEDAISAAAKDQLFEFNDELTRTNFVNIVEPFLRDVQAKRGIFDFVVICDETNNTAAVIDSNEFVADIFIKPARSINFIGLTFVATRTGVAFEEVIGSV
jgi:phage tail sheath protein FI